MIAIAGTVGQAKGIIDYTCLVLFYLFTPYFQNAVNRTITIEHWFILYNEKFA